MKLSLLAAPVLSLALSTPVTAPVDPSPALRSLFEQQVERRLHVPQHEQRDYVNLLHGALARDGLSGLTPQAVLVVDRNPNVQAILLFVITPAGSYQLIGATPASTGKPGDYEYFETPLGVFRHHPGHPDFRAEGTRNDNGVLGYGPKGTRVYDFGWQPARRGWDGGVSLMRMQMHSTDPDLLEPRVGSVQSKGCIRIPLSLNRFIDRYGLIDADYERAAAQGMLTWVLPSDREPSDFAGRYLVIVDSERDARPQWSPLPVVRTGTPQGEVPPGENQLSV